MLFIGGTLDAEERARWRSANFDDIKCAVWDAIVVRHAWMIETYEPEICRRGLATYVEALRYAAHHDLALANFGF